MIWWDRISNIGIKEGFDSAKIRRIHLINRLTFLSVIVTLGYIPFLLALGNTEIIPFQFLSAALLVLTHFIVKTGRYDTGGAYLVIILALDIQWADVYMQDIGTNLFAIPVGIAVFALVKSLRTGYILLGMVALLFVIEQLVAEEVDSLIVLEESMRLSAYYTNIAIIFFICCYIIYHFRKTSETYEQAVELQRDIIAERNEEITDSITYAKRIQEAILPPARSVDKHLPDSFVFYRPKDIVAGDFYWIEPTQGKVIFAAADCTGHGVPGALVSVVCFNALNRSVREFGLTRPSAILDKTRDLVIDQFSKSEEEVKDGMDVAVCSIDYGSRQIQYSGAHNPLWVVRKGTGEIEEIKANKQPVGVSHVSQPFDNHEMQLHEGDVIYLFSDGFADQFGGERGKKYKYKAFKQLLKDSFLKPMSEQHHIIANEFDKWKGELEQVDDVCVIGVRL